MAEVYKRENGWKVRVSFKGNDGKRHYRSREGLKTKKQADAIGTELEYQLQHGGDLNDHNVDLLTYFKKWYETFRKPNASIGTQRKYQYTINQIAEYFDYQQLRKISTSNYQAFLNWLGQGDGTKQHTPHAKATVEKVNTHIRGAIRNAKNDGIIDRDFTLNPQHSCCL